MNAKTRKTLNQLNRLYRILGTWQGVADETGINRATVNRWFAGTRQISEESAGRVAMALDWHRA